MSDILTKPFTSMQNEIDALKAAMEDRDKMHEQHVQALEAERLRLKALLKEALELLMSTDSFQLRGGTSYENEWIKRAEKTMK